MASASYDAVVDIFRNGERTQANAESNQLVSFPSYLAHGTSLPSTVWNIYNDGQYNFSGSAFSGWRYTNVKFTGCVKYYVVIENEAQTSSLSYAVVIPTTTNNESITAGAKRYYTVTMDSRDTEWYFRFDGPCSINGYVERSPLD